MALMDSIKSKAKNNPMTVAFPESTDKKMLSAARISADEGICRPLLVGSLPAILSVSEEYDISLKGMDIFDTDAVDQLAEVITNFCKNRPELSPKSIRRKTQNNLYTALLLQETGRADCTFAGITCSTGDVILAAQLIIGLKPDISAVSSFGIFDIPGYNGSEGTLLGFGDSAVCVDPSPEELASIAISCCDSISKLCGWSPRCAFLSYSSDGSAESEKVGRVRTALAIAKSKRPDLQIDGEFQLDSAIDSKIAAKKIKRNSNVAGQANIVIWPDLNVGNICVKAVQQFAHGHAYGPSLQGFNKVVSDCSRSATVEELVGNIAMTCVLAAYS